MLVALATHPGDYDRAIELADWLLEVPCEYSKHTALIVGASTMDSADIFQLAGKFREAGFKMVTSIQAKTEEIPAWPNAANAMWRLAANWVKDFSRSPWLWMEPDSIPVQSGWLDRIQAEYLAAKRAFMGTRYSIPYIHLNGVAVYPANIQRFNPLMLNSEFFTKPFDTVRPDLTLRDVHFTGLIHRALYDPQSNTPHTFDTIESIAIIPQDCVLFHGCKDGSLIARLRELHNPPVPAEQKVSLGQKLVDGVKRLIGTGPYYHSGNLGDVIYGLPAIKVAGGGDLLIGPEQRRTAICSIPIDRKQFDMFLPLLKRQPYLENIGYVDKYPSQCRDLNHFRSVWINRTLCRKHGIDTLCKAHFYELGVLNKFDENEPWLTCEDPIVTNKTICHRSPRYNSPPAGTETFPWQRVVDKLHSDLLFVGLESEHDTFCRAFGKKVSFWRVSDFNELARLIKGAPRFIGNQSMPLSIAIGLGQNVICEALPRSPDCRFHRANYQDQLLGEINL